MMGVPAGGVHLLAILLQPQPRSNSCGAITAKFSSSVEFIYQLLKKLKTSGP
jgi:hypothetical protein